jgi:hypothetical protein
MLKMQLFQMGLGVYSAYALAFLWQLSRNELGEFQLVLWLLQLTGLLLLFLFALKSDRKYMYSVFVFLLTPSFQILAFGIRDQFVPRVAEEVVLFWPLIVVVIVLPSTIVSAVSFGAALLIKHLKA